MGILVYFYRMNTTAISRRQAIQYTSFFITTMTILSVDALQAGPLTESSADYDVIIVGGSIAGLSAALALGRSLRRVLVIDSGKPCNRQTPHSHNFLTRDGETPAQLNAIARAQATAYPSVTILDSRVTTLSKTEGGFAVTTDPSVHYQFRKVLLATGVEDLMPPIDGFAESWGRSVAHCPYCHGYEVHGQPLGVLGNGDAGFEYVQLIQNWSKNLTLFTNGPATLTDEQLRDVRRLDVSIVETPIARIIHEDGFMRAVQLKDGSHVELTFLLARIPFRQHSDLAQQVGCELATTGLIIVSPFGETNVPGLYAAGDNSSLMRSLVMASASGTTAGAWMNRELIGEDVAAR